MVQKNMNSAPYILRVGQNRIYSPYMIFLPKIPFLHRIYMVLANPKHAYTKSEDLQRISWSGIDNQQQTHVC
jgi:hypothetical protein